MPLVRKILNIGGSKAITLPKGWLEFYESKHGTIHFVTIEVNKTLKVAPLISEKEEGIELSLIHI